MVKKISNTQKIKNAKANGRHTPKLTEKTVREVQNFYQILTGSNYMTLSYSPVNFRMIKAVFSNVGDTVLTEITKQVAKRQYLWTIQKNEWEKGHISINHARWIRLIHDIARRLPPPWLTRPMANGAIVYIEGYGWVDRNNFGNYDSNKVLVELVIEGGRFNTDELIDFMRNSPANFKRFINDKNPMPAPPAGFTMDVQSIIDILAGGAEVEVPTSDGPDTWVDLQTTLDEIKLAPGERHLKTKTPSRFVDIKNDYTLARVDAANVLIVRRKDSMTCVAEYQYQPGEDLDTVYKALSGMKKIKWSK